MKIKDKVNLDTQGLIEHGPITIVAFGDSVTHGALADNEYDYNTVYWNRLRQKINQTYPFVPVNVINAGISGISAEHSLPRLESQVLIHNPDLVTVCFGLNDVNGSLENYINSLRIIFEKCMQKGAEVIFMSPNTMNTYVADDTLPQLVEYAGITANYQNNGKMDMFIQKAIELANEMGVKVCDCYGEWKKLAQTQDTTMLLANRINHPKRELHELFANCLFETIFND